jgi:hypothetical protein
MLPKIIDETFEDYIKNYFRLIDELVEQFCVENKEELDKIMGETILINPQLNENSILEAIKQALKGNFSSSHPENIYNVGMSGNIVVLVRTTMRGVHINVLKSINHLNGNDMGIGKITLRQLYNNISDDLKKVKVGGS